MPTSLPENRFLSPESLPVLTIVRDHRLTHGNVRNFNVRTSFAAFQTQRLAYVPDAGPVNLSDSAVLSAAESLIQSKMLFRLLCLRFSRKTIILIFNLYFQGSETLWTVYTTCTVWQALLNVAYVALLGMQFPGMPRAKNARGYESLNMLNCQY